ncbi:hypothetical protein GCM10009560_15950 [Nonomuraea longicatena]|uniref:Uncharacterized protein n=1 Tax=Nonomuraea longicatena TaxID=83682 RepID=A0ABN1NX63_9ACTN
MLTRQNGRTRVCMVAAAAGWATSALAGALVALGPAGPSAHAFSLLAMWLLAVPILASVCAARQRHRRARTATAQLAYELGTLHEQDLAPAMPLR